MTLEDVPEVNRLLKKEFRAHAAPIIELIEAQTHDPFCVLVGTILSARTKDQCTAGAVKRLFARMGGTATPDALEAIPVPELEKLIFPVGFFRDKARHLHALPWRFVPFCRRDTGRRGTRTWCRLARRDAFRAIRTARTARSRNSAHLPDEAIAAGYAPDADQH